jgi:beta-phosphoglucomutase
MNTSIKAVILDLDGVLTDTSEFHYLAWKQLADEEGLSFSQAESEYLRGVSRRGSLLQLLEGRQYEEAKMQEMMRRKNRIYQNLLTQLTPVNLRPGLEDFFNLLTQANVRVAVTSAGQNVRDVLQRLGMADRLAVLVDGDSIAQEEPAPHLFRRAAARLNLVPSECLVVDDSPAGIEAARIAGMPCLALGPAERFAEAERKYGSLARRDDLVGIQLSDLTTFAQRDQTWSVIQTEFGPENQHHMETIFTIGNGYFSSRGSLEEGYPGESSLTLAHGVFDDMPISRTELANLPNWLDLGITVDDHTFRLDQGQCLHLDRWLDLRQGILYREVRWQAPNGTVLDITFERFVSYSHEHVGAMRILITAVSQPCRITVEAGINGHVSNEDLLHWNHVDQGQSDKSVIWLHSRTRASKIDLAVACSIHSPDQPVISCQRCPGHPRLVLSTELDTAQTLQIDKLVSYTASRDHVQDAGDVVGRAVAELEGKTYDGLRAAQVHAWDTLWQTSDVVIEGDAEAQIAIRFNLFQLIVAAPQHDERVSIGAKTLSGLGYRGHVFWDTEIFILPFFTFTQPHIARNMLMYRYHTLAGARQKAADNGFSGAQYAWESAATGEEVTPSWVPDFKGKYLVRIWTGDIEIHISSDIAYAIIQYWRATGDETFMRDYGAEIILDSARFWGERAELEEEDGRRCYALRDVIGPDEYHDHVDNNVYTNRMAQWHLQQALVVLDWLDQQDVNKANDLRQQLDLTPECLAHWQDVIYHIIVHHDPETGLMVQFDGFFERKFIAPEVIASAEKSMQVVLGIKGANASQVLKQADVIMLLCLLRDEYDARTWQTNWETYMPRTDHRYGSSLGPSIHAWAACEMNRPDEAYQHFMLAAQADLRDVRGNANDGIHGASAGGLWQAIVFGFAGLRLTDNGLAVDPRLPAHWTRLRFSVRYRGESYGIDIPQGGGMRITKR